MFCVCHNDSCFVGWLLRCVVGQWHKQCAVIGESWLGRMEYIPVLAFCVDPRNTLIRRTGGQPKVTWKGIKSVVSWIAVQ